MQDVLVSECGGVDPVPLQPPLYAVWGHLTEHGGGLGDALAFGRIAGRSAVST